MCTRVYVFVSRSVSRSVCACVSLRVQECVKVNGEREVVVSASNSKRVGKFECVLRTRGEEESLEIENESTK